MPSSPATPVVDAARRVFQTRFPLTSLHSGDAIKLSLKSAIGSLATRGNREITSPNHNMGLPDGHACFNLPPAEQQVYSELGRASRGLIGQYIEKMTGLSRAQTTRLIGNILGRAAARKSLPAALVGDA
jgi:hypothetical protein